jgi:hypothetical protein
MNCLKSCSVEKVNEKENARADLLGCFPSRVSIRVRKYLSCVKRKKDKLNRQQVKEWLASQEAYTMHRRMLKKFHRNKGITRGIDDLWQIDLADMQNISKYNDNF